MSDITAEGLVDLKASFEAVKTQLAEAKKVDGIDIESVFFEAGGVVFAGMRDGNMKNVEAARMLVDELLTLCREKGLARHTPKANSDDSWSRFAAQAIWNNDVPQASPV